MKKLMITLFATASLLAACGQSPDSSEDKNSQASASQNSTAEGNSSTENTSSDTSTAAASVEETIEKIPVGEEASFSIDEQEAIGLTINEVSGNPADLPRYMESSEEYNTDNIIAVTYDYRNINYPENLIITTHDLQVYDENGRSLEKLSLQDGDTEVSKGRSATATAYYSFEDASSNHSKVEIDFVPVTLGTNERLATFEVNLEQ